MYGSGKKYFHCVDLHCGGEPARILLSGCPEIPGNTMAEKRMEFMNNFDHIRKTLLQEPRGYPCQNLNIIFPSQNPNAKYGYVIAEQNRIYPLFSGHNTICVVTALLETGMVEMKYPETKFNLESPGGLVNVRAQCKENQVENVILESMPSFVGWSNRKIFVESLKDYITVDCAFGGMWYAIVNIDTNWTVGIPKLDPNNGKRLANLGEEIKLSLQRSHPIQHPELDYQGPDILAFISDLKRDVKPGVSESRISCKNTVVMSAGISSDNKYSAILDRSPCGSGTAAIMANLFQKGFLQLNEILENESIIGSKFIGKLLRKGPILEGNVKTVIPEISGSACITGFNNLVISPNDPFPYGYTVADIWT